MNRRGFFGLLSAAMASICLPSGVVAKLLEPKPSLLEKTKWFLLPGLWATFQDTEIESDIRVDEEQKCLIIFAKSWESGLGFTITENAIKRGYYLEDYTKTLPLLKKYVVEQHEWEKWNGDAYVTSSNGRFFNAA